MKNLDERKSFNIRTQKDYIKFMAHIENIILHTNKGIKIIPKGRVSIVDTFDQIEEKESHFMGGQYGKKTSVQHK